MNTLLDTRIPSAILLEPREVYDQAVVGITLSGKAIYDARELVRLTVKHDAMPWPEAVEWHRYNTFTSFPAGNPLFVNEPSAYEDVAEDEEE
jgi:hypothetical protein